MTNARLEIADEDRLYRRLVAQHLRPDGTVNSYAFMLHGQPDPAISVDLARLSTPEESAGRAGRPGVGIGELVAALPRALGLEVRHDPLPENAAHTLILGAASKADCRRLAEAVRVMLPPLRPTS